MQIAINIGWSILLLIVFILFIYLFQEKIGNSHSFLAFMLYSIGMCLMINGDYITSSEMGIIWIGLMLVAIFCSGMFVTSLCLSLQITLIGMYGLYQLPQYSYTWANQATTFILSKVSIGIFAIIGLVFLAAIIIGADHTDDKENAKDGRENLSNGSSGANEFSFANGYRKGNDESVYYSLYNSVSNDSAILHDDHGNEIKAYIWSTENGTLKDDAGNIYFPWG